MTAEPVKESRIHFFIVIATFFVVLIMTLSDISIGNLISLTFFVGFWPVTKASKLLGPGHALKYNFMYAGLCILSGLVLLLINIVVIAVIVNYYSYGIDIYSLISTLSIQAISIIFGQLITVQIIRKKRSNMLGELKKQVSELSK